MELIQIQQTEKTVVDVRYIPELRSSRMSSQIYEGCDLEEATFTTIDSREETKLMWDGLIFVTAYDSITAECAAHTIDL
jgi:hypothetical protein